MKRCIVLGKANVGKSLFVLSFAEYLGVQKVSVTIEEPGRHGQSRTVSVRDAMAQWVSDTPHQTRALHAVQLELPVGKGVKRFELVDTSGLSEGIPRETAIRRAMAQTLAAVREADLVLHIVDASAAAQEGAVEAIGEVDFQVAHFAQMKGGYLILANKMDLPTAKEGLERIRQEFAGHPVIPVSARTKDGFREVRRYVWRWI